MNQKEKEEFSRCHFLIDQISSENTPAKKLLSTWSAKDAVEDLMLRIQRRWGSEKKIDDTDTLLVALSGGADSVGLLARLVREYEGIISSPRIFAVYINHGMGDRAEQDEEYRIVRTVCEKLGVFLCASSIVWSSPHRSKSETTLRRERYERIFECAKHWCIRYVLTAHHKVDVYETVVLRLFRYGGWRGVSGIPSIRRVVWNDHQLCIMRPALNVMPNALHVSYLEHYSDPSNARSHRYLRNAIRNNLSKSIEKFFPCAVKNTSDFAHDQMRVRHLVSEALPAWLRRENCISVSAFIISRMKRMRREELLIRGANILGIQHVSARFIDECLEKMEIMYNGIHTEIRKKGSRRLSRYETMLFFGRRNIVWKKWDSTREIHERVHFHKPKNSMEWSDISPLSVPRKMMFRDGHWKDSYNNDVHLPLIYTVRLSPPFFLTFPNKRSICEISDEKGTHRIRIRDVLARDISSLWRQVPVLVGACGTTIVAGETMLGRTLISKEKKSASGSTFNVGIGYHVLYVYNESRRRH